MADYLIVHERNLCVGCGSCASICPENWLMDEDNKSTCKEHKISKLSCNKDASDACPVACIKIEGAEK